MKLLELLQPLLSEVPSVPDISILGLQNDSRRIQSGDLFLAYPGATTDGRQYIQQAIDAQASAILYDPDNFATDVRGVFAVPIVPIFQLEKRLGVIASRFYDNPSQKLRVTGVTGTNGKTTIAYQLAQAYGLLGSKTAYVGTLGQGDVHQLQVLLNTTPDALCVQRLMHDYLAEGITQVCMEVSSHALSLGRVDCVDFIQAIYTNLSHDHLDFHETMDAYALAKASLFSKNSLQCAVINQDDSHSALMQKGLPANCRSLLYGLNDKSSVHATRWNMDMSGSTMDVISPWGEHHLRLRSLGRFNLYNSLAVFASLLASEIASPTEIAAVMTELKPSPGRMEIVLDKPCVVVDYAHSPDALENVLLTLVALKQNKIIVVFGCGGDRDKTKRPIMGRIASQYADLVIVTNDNPRTEDPTTITEEILEGIPKAKQTQVILSRQAAIEYALNQTGESDIVLIAGKGHEEYQIIGATKYPFSDQKIVKEWKRAT